MATHSSILAWGIPGMGEPGGLPSMGSHRVGHDWSDLAAVAAAYIRSHSVYSVFSGFLSSKTSLRCIHVVARMCACSVAQLYSILSSPPDFSVHGILAGKNTGADYHFLLQDIFPTHVFCISRQIPYHWATWEAPCISCLFLHMALPWFVFPFTSWWTCFLFVCLFVLPCFSVFGYQRPNCYELYVHIFVWMFVFNSYTYVWNIWATLIAQICLTF